jgi:tartrate dehydratase alpha subunit/fumarate hydratase class I-like protein
MEVAIEQPAWPVPPRLSDLREGTDGTSRIALSNHTLKAGKMVMLDLNFSRTDGTRPNVTPYLGAVAHVVAVFNDGDTLVHVHPMEGGSENQAMLHVTFPFAGTYRLWVEFMDDGVLRKVPLSVVVD